MVTKRYEVARWLLACWFLNPQPARRSRARRARPERTSTGGAGDDGGAAGGQQRPVFFAQQYEGAAPGPVLKAEASAAIVASTVAYSATATGWLALLAAQGHLAD